MTEKLARFIGRIILVMINYFILRYLGASIWESFAFAVIIEELMVIRSSATAIEDRK